MYFMRGARGVEVIPNYTFWKDLPFLIKVRGWEGQEGNRGRKGGREVGRQGGREVGRQGGSEERREGGLYMMRTLVVGFHMIVSHHRWIQRPGIHCVQQAIAYITTPTVSILNAHNGYWYLCILDTQQWSFPLYLQKKIFSQLCTNINRVFCINNCIILHFFKQVSITLAILQLHRIYCSNTF